MLSKFFTLLKTYLITFSYVKASTIRVYKIIILVILVLFASDFIVLNLFNIGFLGENFLKKSIISFLKFLLYLLG